MLETLLTGGQAFLMRFGVKIVIGLTLFALGFLKGCQYESSERLKLEQNLQVVRAKAAAAQEKVTVQVQTVYVEKAARTKFTTEFVKQEVAEYEKQNVTMCIDDTWLRLHNAAASNSASRGSEGVDGGLPKTPSGAGPSHSGSGAKRSNEELQRAP